MMNICNFPRLNQTVLISEASFTISWTVAYFAYKKSTVGRQYNDNSHFNSILLLCDIGLMYPIFFKLRIICNHLLLL